MLISHVKQMVAKNVDGIYIIVGAYTRVNQWVKKPWSIYIDNRLTIDF